MTTEKAHGLARSDARLARIVLGLQVVYFVTTGIWPVAHIKSFMWVTGPKEDIWLVKTFGTLVAGTGLGMAWTLLRRRDPAALIPVSAGASASLLTCDLYYVARGRVRPTYLLDAAANGFFCLCWIFLNLTSSRRGRKRR